MLLLDDKEILKLYNQGGVFCEKAFRAIVQQYSEQVYWQIRRSTKNHEDTNDVLQNTLIKVYRNLNKFKGESAISTWLYSIARNETYTFLEKRNKRSKNELDNSFIALTANASTFNDLDAEQIEKLLQTAIDTLPLKQAQVFQLKYFEDLSYQEISVQLGTSIGGLKASYHHAVKKIKESVVNQLNL